MHQCPASHPYWVIRSFAAEVMISDAEALTFARQLPEVRALIAAAKEMLEHQDYHDFAHLREALVPFEEA
jgi:hypothetical protein